MRQLGREALACELCVLRIEEENSIETSGRKGETDLQTTASRETSVTRKEEHPEREENESE